MCADIDSYTLHNDPYWFSSGAQLNAVVNSCAIAKQVEIDNGLTHWNDDPCEEDETTRIETLHSIAFEAKIVQQAFNPKHYIENGTTDYLVSQRIVSGLSSYFNQGRFTYAEIERVRFRAGWLASMSSIAYDSLFGSILG